MTNSNRKPPGGASCGICSRSRRPAWSRTGWRWPRWRWWCAGASARARPRCAGGRCRWRARAARTRCTAGWSWAGCGRWLPGAATRGICSCLDIFILVIFILTFEKIAKIALWHDLIRIYRNCVEILTNFF